MRAKREVKKTTVLNQVGLKRKSDGCTLFFQEINIKYKDGNLEHGYTFVWKDEDGKMTPMRGRVRIPDVWMLERLVGLAKEQGWLSPYEAEKDWEAVLNF